MNVSFVPERNFLGAVAKDIRDKQRAYPLAMLAGLFLQKPEHHQIKFEARAGKGQPPPLKFWQNLKTGMVFLRKEAAQAFAVSHDLPEFFDVQDVAVEPPSGNFVCVGRCSLSGELLGPPNFHGYSEKLMELHRSRFSGMPLDEYRSRVEVVRDPAVVEQWKEQAKSVRRYREKTDSTGEFTLKRAEAEFIMSQKYAKNLFRESARCLMPGARAMELPDRELKFLLREAWTREDRFPLTLLHALRAAFKYMKLQTFKVGREVFATAVAPKPIVLEHCAENVRVILEALKANPGCQRKKLLELIAPGTDIESDAGKELLSPLRWLVEKGHVIEFFNATLSLPSEEIAQTLQLAAEKKSASAPAAETTGAESAQPELSAAPTNAADETVDESAVAAALEAAEQVAESGTSESAAAEIAAASGMSDEPVAAEAVVESTATPAE